MNADELTKLTTDALDQRSTALEQGPPSEYLTALKTRARFHRDGIHDVYRILNQRRQVTRVARAMETV